MSTEIDNDTSIDNESNVVPEPTAASGFGNQSLDADKIDDSTEARIDALLDESIRDTAPDFKEDDSSGEEDAQNLIAAETPKIERDSRSVEASSQTNQVEATPVAEIDPEIAAIEQPRNLSEKNQSNWRKLQETASVYKKQAEEAQQLRSRLQELESQAPQVQTPADYEELRKFRQIFDIKNDPEFKSKYEQPLGQAKENIYGILKKHGASDEVIQSIEKAGGPDKIDQAWWKNNAIDKLPLTDSERLKRNLVDVVDLKERQEKELEFVAQNAEQIMQERQMETYNWYQAENQNIEDHVDQLTKDLPWARYMEAAQGASQEELSKIQQHNAVVDSLAEKFNAALWPQTAQDRTNVAAAAVFSHVLTEELQKTQKAYADTQSQLKKLTEENNRLKGAGKLPRSNVGSSNSVKANSLSDRIKMSPMDAIDFGLDEAGA
jgi:hypothetical protein